MRLRLMVPTVSAVTLLLSAQAFAGPVVVTCGSGQRAVVRDAFVRGETVTKVACISGRSDRQGTYRTPDYEARYRARRPHRSWGKSALIIAGSAGTGGGIGGIVNGKKGALIGSALGAGVGSLYEGAHRR
jgi:hypothetical protein